MIAGVFPQPAARGESAATALRKHFVEFVNRRKARRPFVKPSPYPLFFTQEYTRWFWRKDIMSLNGVLGRLEGKEKANGGL